jgi:hypothetical protein
MHLVYVDESGNSGLNLKDPQQPVFCLCAMVVDESQWKSLEDGLKAVLDARIPDWRSRDKFEVHAADLRCGTGHFAGMSVADRVALRDDWMAVGSSHGVRLIHRSIQKTRYAEWLVKEFGQGVIVNPHIAAFALVTMCVDGYLKALPNSPRGMLISDENKEIVADVEKSIRIWRGAEHTIKTSQIVEKGFFIDSSKSLPLQLCDLFTLSLRKRAERMLGAAAKPIDDSGIATAEKLLYTDNKAGSDVLEWLKSLGNERKKEAARG